MDDPIWPAVKMEVLLFHYWHAWAAVRRKRWPPWAVYDEAFDFDYTTYGEVLTISPVTKIQTHGYPVESSDLSMGCKVQERCTICEQTSCVHLGPFVPGRSKSEVATVLIGPPMNHGKSFLQKELHTRTPDVLIVDHRPFEQQRLDPIIGPVIDVIQPKKDD